MADCRDVLRGGVYFLKFFTFEVGNRRILEDLSNKIGRERSEFFVEHLDVGIGSDHCCFQRGFATSWGDGLVCGFVSGLELAIRYSIPYLEGSHDPNMMSEVVPRFEPFERCCMAILFVGGRGKTTPHPTSPPLLR